MKRHTAQEMDGITSDIIKLEGGGEGGKGGGGQIVLTYLVNIFINILKTRQIPESWHEAKIVILFKKGGPKGGKDYRPISPLSHSYKTFVDYEKAFDTVEHFAIFETVRKTNVNETYINILQNIYRQATARIHLDK